MYQKRSVTITALLLALAVLMIVFGVFYILYYYDNKYTAGPPYGNEGILTIEDSDLSRPVFLIDGWELYPDALYTPDEIAAAPFLPKLDTFIGQYSNFSYFNKAHTAFGSATYRIVIRNQGSPRILSLDLPEIFTDYTLWINDTIMAVPKSGTLVNFYADKETTILLNTSNYSHYYSGLTYPPALGTPEVIHRLTFIRTVFYTTLCVSSLTLALFSIILWFSREREAYFRHFGALCLFFGIHCLHPLFWQLGGMGSFWYALEDVTWLAVLTESVAIVTQLAGFTGTTWYRKFIRPFLLLSLFLTVFLVIYLIPNNSTWIGYYGIYTNCIKIFCWVYLVIGTGKGLQSGNVSALFTLSGCCILGVSLFTNLLDNNYFEPAYTGWQNEYAGLLLVAVFGGLMTHKNIVILEQNRILNTELEKQVAQRTDELKFVLEERKNFFSEMAHNLKAPIAAIHGFISLIREGSLYVDDELLGYISLIENENLEMRRRVQSLNTLNAFDRIKESCQDIEIHDLLREVYEDNEPESSAAGIYFTVIHPDTNAYLHAQPEKIRMLFENLIYNALAFTPPEGTITISAQVQQEELLLLVSDTGSGIAPEHLPHIFERFYSVRDNQKEGSGLGLYMVKMIVEELGGNITVDSVLQVGTTFEIHLPVVF